MESEPFVYEARYGMGGRTWRVLVTALVFVILGITLRLPLAVRVLDFALFGLGGLVMLGVGLSRQVAFRVGPEGVTLGGVPPRYQSGTRVVPWTDIERVVLWRQGLPRGRSMLYVGLVRCVGAPPLAGRTARAAGRAVAATLTPGISAETLGASRAVNGWRLDPGRLVAAVGHFAPGVPVDR